MKSHIVFSVPLRRSYTRPILYPPNGSRFLNGLKICFVLQNLQVPCDSVQFISLPEIHAIGNPEVPTRKVLPCSILGLICFSVLLENSNHSNLTQLLRLTIIFTTTGHLIISHCWIYVL